jgi:hypothetical protein
MNALFGGGSTGAEKSSSNSHINATTALETLNNYRAAPHNHRLPPHYPSHYQLNPTDSFMSLDNNYIAEQLTYIDKCLFQEVSAHHCLGAVWGQRHQKKNNQSVPPVIMSNSRVTVTSESSAGTPLTTSSLNNETSVSASPPPPTTIIDKFASIRAFIDQFNCVSFVVQATILERIGLKPVERARIVRKWIEIAQECRKYKNFSALNAIVQGLNTQCVSRLEKTWNEVPGEAKAQFNELTEMFSQDQNQRIFREILMKVNLCRVLFFSYFCLFCFTFITIFFFAVSFLN